MAGETCPKEIACMLALGFCSWLLRRGFRPAFTRDSTSLLSIMSFPEAAARTQSLARSRPIRAASCALKGQASSGVWDVKGFSV